MPPQVVHADDRHAPGQTQTTGKSNTQRKAARQTGAVRDRDLGNRTALGRKSSGLEQREKILEMLATGEVRDDPTVFLMQFNLAVHPLTRHARIWVEAGQGGLVARTFNRQYHINQEVRRQESEEERLFLFPCQRSAS